MFVAVPRNVMVLSLVPSPEVNVRPVVPERVKLPFVTETVTSKLLPLASGSVIAI